MPARIAKYWLRRNEIAGLPMDSVDARSCVNRLRSLSEAGIALCRRSRRLEATSDDITAAAYIAAWRGQPLADPPYATVITKLHVSSPGMSNVAQLIIGHEAAGVVLMDNTSFTVTMSWELEGVPAMIDVIGAHFYWTCWSPCRLHLPMYHTIAKLFVPDCHNLNSTAVGVASHVLGPALVSAACAE